MNIIPSLVALMVLALAGPTVTILAAAEEGVALAIIYDTSRSMRDPVPDEAGRMAPKYVIANRALEAVANRLQIFATNNAASGARTIHAGLFIFQGQGAREAIQFGPLDAGKLRDWAASFSSPNGNTPLGNALSVAGRKVLGSPLTRKHVLVITDGMNTAGPPPAAIWPRLKQQAQQGGNSLPVHFVAFDVDARVFDSVKKQGATVVGAADEKQLNSQLEFILQRKILLEEEESPKK